MVDDIQISSYTNYSTSFVFYDSLSFQFLGNSWENVQCSGPPTHYKRYSYNWSFITFLHTFLKANHKQVLKITFHLKHHKNYQHVSYCRASVL